MFRKATGVVAAAVVALLLATAPGASARPTQGNKIVYLTFDDGPNAGNDATLLKILQRERVPATFFLVGSELAGDRKAAARLWLAGHAVGNHTYSHVDLSTLDIFGIQHQLLSTQKLLGAAGGRCMRPPYGAVSSAVYAAARQDGLKPVLWTVDPQDWAHQDTGYIVNHVLTHVHDHAVVLLHDGGGNRMATVAAVRQLIPQLRARGYEFRTVPACRVPLAGQGLGAAQERQPRPAPTPTPTPTVEPTPAPTATPTPTSSTLPIAWTGA